MIALTWMDYSAWAGQLIFLIAFFILWKAGRRQRFEARRANWKNRILDGLIRAQSDTISKHKTEIIEWRAFVQRLYDMDRLKEEGVIEAERRLQGDEEEYVRKEQPDA
jgi:hypothetical protein